MNPIYCDVCKETDYKPMYCQDCEDLKKIIKEQLEEKIEDDGYYTVYESGEEHV